MILLALTMFFLMIFAFTGSAAAYSYGNPNKEDLAEAYKSTASALRLNPPNFAAAREQFAPVEQEARLHFPSESVDALKTSLDAGDAEGAIAAFERLLVLNIARRIQNARAQVNQFANAKVLLAKAFSTYEALSPVVKSKEAAADQEIRSDFDAMLKSIGNPGLFGIGKRDPDLAAFDALEDKILGRLAELFGMDAIEVGHFVGH